VGHYTVHVEAIHELDVHGSVHHNTNRIEITKKMRPCSKIY